jgi:hypothetical protein
VLLFQAILLFLFPLGVYCLVLAHINRRERPLLLSGAWDVIAMLAAGAGFFLVLVPTLFDHLYHRTILGAFEHEEDFATLWVRWWLVWVAYYSCLIVLGLLLIVWRRHKTVIYNVDTEAFPHIFSQAVLLARLESHPDAEKPGRFIVVLPTPPDTAVTAPRRAPLAHVFVEAYPTGCHVTLHWEGYMPHVRAEVEQQLRKILDQMHLSENPLATWFLILSGLIFGLIALVVLAVYLSIYLRHH